MKINSSINLNITSNQSNFSFMQNVSNVFEYNPNQAIKMQRDPNQASYFYGDMPTFLVAHDAQKSLIKLDNKDYISYFKTTLHYVVDEETYKNLTSKLNSSTLNYLLFKEGNLDLNTQVIDEKQIFKIMIDDMIIEQTQNILGVTSRHEYSMYSFGNDARLNYSYANKFSPDAGNYKADNYSNQNPLIPNSYYLNSYANSNLIDTKFGKAELFLDLADNNDKLGVGTFSSNSQLFRFDSDGNGFVDKNDDYFDKLKIRAYDKDGNEIIKKLSEVVDSIDLKDFIDSKSNALNKWKEEVSSYGWDEKTYEEQLNIISSYNPYSIFKPEVRYESLSQNDLNELSKLADEDGWIDVANLQGIDLAYAKKGIDGNYKLNELNYLGISNNQANSYANEQYAKFNALYEDYMAEINALNEFFNSYKQVANDEIMAEFGAFIENPEFKSTIMLQIEREFTSATGLKFSLENLQKVKDSFEQDRANTANMLKDTDVLTAIRINKNGTFTLKFNSGREINVNELYKDSGKAFDIELNLNAKFMSEIELNQNLDLVVSLAKVKDEITGNMQTKPLKELGVEIIKKLSNNKFILQTNDNRSIIIDQLYTKLNDKEKDQNSNKNQIDDKEKFYPKPLKIWA
ncbi:hypothetical protein CVIC9261_07435 [Campylobacter vicugnae]|uniref:Response regulator n=3 Tax=Campylobacteraceae TaxID=72294 RepID=A0ABZ2E762_9BACT|nr:hypothetical protein [Campylobacter sp. RM12175]ARR04511.1 hypothetical protein CVIC12175_1409 [Campylobacter sp. RM12175]